MTHTSDPPGHKTDIATMLEPRVISGHLVLLTTLSMMTSIPRQSGLSEDAVSRVLRTADGLAETVRSASELRCGRPIQALHRCVGPVWMDELLRLRFLSQGCPSAWLIAGV